VKIIRPDFPEGYLPDSTSLLDWDYVEECLRTAHNYWLCTVRPNGHPHVIPKWGVWVTGKFYFDGSPETRHARNLATNLYVSVHLESGDQVVILEGEVREVSEDPLFTTLSETYYTKYQVKLTHNDPVYVLVPEKAFAWIEQDFPNTATRWSFDEE